MLEKEANGAKKIVAMLLGHIEYEQKKVENQVLNMNSTLSFDLLRLWREFSQSTTTCKELHK